MNDSTPLPDWINFNNYTRQLSGAAPRVTDSFEFIITVSDEINKPIFD